MIQIRNLQKAYGENQVLHHFSATIPDHGIVCITGVSGRGKTTLLRILSGLEPADGGQIEGLSGRKIAFVFQEDRLLPWISAAQNIHLAQPDQPDSYVQGLLAAAGLAQEGAKRPGQLSGGQRRRVAFLRGIAFLAGVPDGVLMLDEPFNGLDAAAAQQLCDILRSLPPQTLVLLVSHQLSALDGMDVSFLPMEDSL